MYANIYKFNILFSILKTDDTFLFDGTFNIIAILQTNYIYINVIVNVIILNILSCVTNFLAVTLSHILCMLIYLRRINVLALREYVQLAGI